MRWNDSDNERANACASVVLPTPGTSSRRMWPFDRRAAMQNCTTSDFPRMTRSTFACSVAILSNVRLTETGSLAIPGVVILSAAQDDAFFILHSDFCIQ